MIISLAAALVVGQAGWQSPAYVRVSGTERYLDGKDHAVSAARTPKGLLVTATRSIDGQLANVGRGELVSSGGVFTWLLEGGDGWALQLPAVSSADFATMLAPARVAPQDVVGDPARLSKLFGKTVSVKPEETVAGRQCFVLSIASGSSTQILWIDREAGITLRLDDVIARQSNYFRTFDQVDTKGTQEPVSGAPPFSRIIRGIPQPQILQQVSQTLMPDLKKDIGAARKASRLASGSWIREIDSPSGFDYVQTVRQEGPGKPEPRRTNDLGGPQLEPGGLPPGWSVSGAVDPESGNVGFAFQGADGTSPRVLIADPKAFQDGSSFGIQIGDISIEFVAYYDKSGALIIAPGHSAKEAEKARQRRLEELAGASGWVQSDFLDRATGETVSFLQMRGADLDRVLRRLRLPKGEPAGDALSGAQKFTMDKPLRLTIVRWTTPDGVYAVASSKLGVEELTKLALTVR